MAAARRSRKVGVGAVVLLTLVIAVLALATGHQRRIVPGIGSGCMVRGRSLVVPLTTDQAGIAATIAGVARDRSMPVRAVTIAYAAALQETDLANLAYGDRDSVGIFQQRPSQGWGPRHLLLDPVYATTRFFRALARVRGYRHLLVYQAAQAVQHSADGYAYRQYSGQGAAMAAGFTGRLPHAVWCWYSSAASAAPAHSRLAAARTQLTRTFGHLSVVRAKDPALRIRVGKVPTGWSVAAWLVTHAGAFGIRSIGYDGYAWTARHAARGWRRVAADPRRASARLAVTFG